MSIDELSSIYGKLCFILQAYGISRPKDVMSFLLGRPLQV